MNKKEYKELKGLIVDGFAKVDDRFSGLEDRFSGLEDRIAWLEENGATKSDIEKILAILDDQSKYFQEQDMLKGQVGRHDKWINKIALKTETQLDY